MMHTGGRSRGEYHVWTHDGPYVPLSEATMLVVIVLSI